MQKQIKETQNIIQIRCPKCNRIPGASIKTGKAFMTHICHQSCGNIYWTLQLCPYCDRPQATILIQRPRYGELITCKHCLKGFYLFICPKEQCKSLFFKSKDYYLMGQPVSCVVCNLNYKQIVCQCSYEIILNPKTNIVEGQSGYKCNSCSKNVIYTICGKCFKTNYHPDALELGHRYKCTHCKQITQYVPCPCCGRTTKHQKFNFCKLYKCQFCKSAFQYSSCPYCILPNYHMTEKPLGPARKCSNKQCNSTYYVLSCYKCDAPTYFDQFDTSQGRQEQCPQCKVELKFYYCRTCHQFNPSDSKCSNEKCPKPTGIKSYTKQQKEMKKKESKEQQDPVKKLNSNYKQTQCKICFANLSNMVNTTCGHVMMCEDCLKVYRAAKGNKDPTNSAACPVCKKIGIYAKTVEYIYQ